MKIMIIILMDVKGGSAAKISRCPLSTKGEGPHAYSEVYLGLASVSERYAGNVGTSAVRVFKEECGEVI
jgi:hypothetical protein